MRHSFCKPIFTFIASLLLLTPQFSFTQATQTIRGTITDQQSKTPISFVTISVDGLQLSAISDSMGVFVLKDIPFGRQTLAFSRVGYEPQLMNNVVVEAGKESIVNIEMLENLAGVQDVVVTGKKRIAGKQMASNSVVAFNAEDTRRFAGSRNDVARMATNFAGAASLNDGRNDIIVRGNSPSGLLWRLEGVDIPNPNHYSSFGATGGPVSMLNNNVLGQSAFFTGAFPAQYGNALSGAFDVRLRNGNNKRTEFTAQIGFNGLEAGAEGPFSKKSNASYLIYYRYSIPGLISKLGLDVGTGAAVPYYQDLSLKVNLPTKKAGQFTLFGIGGSSHIDFKADLADTTNFYNDPYNNLYNGTKTGVAGITHTYFFNSSTSTNLTFAATGATVTTKIDSLDEHSQPHKTYRENGSEWRYIVSGSLNKKFSPRDRLSTGFMLDQLHYSYADSVKDGVLGFIPFLTGKGKTELLRAHAQWQHRFSDRLTLNTGVYGQWLTLNNSYSIESRFGARYQVGKSSVISLAYGMHSQMQSLFSYFLETQVGSSYVQTNYNLGFTKSHHIVAGWEKQLKSGWRYKLEGYTQLLRDVPVESKPSNWSALNTGADYGDGRTDSLVNKGSGYNYGLELTVEKPFSNGFYVLSTISLFDSKYKGSNGVEHNTAFNGRYVVNLLGGKEWKIKEKHSIAVDLKFTAAGGRRYTPIDLQASQIAGKAIFDEARSYDESLKDYLRFDLKLTYRMQGKRMMQEFFIDFQNLTNYKNVYSQWYDSRVQRLRTQNQLGFYPNFNFRVQF